MKIAFWSTSYFRGFGGAEKIVNDMLHSLNPAEFKLFLITERIDKGQVNNHFFRPLPAAVEIYQNTFTNPLLALHHPLLFLIRLLKYLKAALQLGLFFWSKRIDVIHLHMVNIDVLLLILYKYLFRYRLVITFTGMEILLADAGVLSKWKMKAALHHADRVTTVSRDIGRQLAQKFNYPNSHYIRNGIDIKAIETIAGQPSADVEAGSFIFCGRLHPVKRITFLIDAYHGCIKAGCGNKLYIIGDGEEREKARERIEAYGIADRVILMGARDHQATMRMMAGGGCLLLSSSSEGNPVVILEAMALGLPVIAPDVGGIGEMISHDVNGFCYPANNQSQFREFILKLAMHPALAQQMGRNAREAVLQNFSHRHMMDQYVDIYRSLADVGQI